MAGEAADEVARDRGAQGGDVVARVVGGDGATGGAGVVVRLAHLQHIVRLWGVLEDELVARLEPLGGGPVGVVGGQVPGPARLADVDAGIAC